MIYTIFAILLFAFLIWFTAHHTKFSSKTVFTANLVMTLIGLTLYLLIFAYLYYSLSVSSVDALFAEWAWNAVKTFMEISGYPMIVFLILTCFAAFSSRIDKKFRSKNSRITRFSCSICCSAVMLLIAFFYSFMAATDVLPLAPCILALGIADALLLRCMFLIEWREK